jgi:phenylacetyl-CoA:acceptor oxidoreductase subunit 1
MNEKRVMDRRDFLKLGGAAGLLVIAAGPRLVGDRKNSAARAASAGHEVGEHQWAMVIDQSKCVGCGHCTQACRAENDVSPDISWNRVIESGEVDGRMTYLPVQCMHCADPPCAHICPVGATYQRSDGIVMMDYERCIGCRYCQMACPFGARSFNWEAFTGDNPAVPGWGQPEVARRPRGVVEKCTFCYQRIDRGLEQGLTPGVDESATPACVVACPVGARTFGDLNDPESPASKAIAEHATFRLREGLGAEPRIHYIPVHAGAGGDETPAECTPEDLQELAS